MRFIAEGVSKLRSLFKARYPFRLIYLLWISFVLLSPERQVQTSSYYLLLLVPYALSRDWADVSRVFRSKIIRLAALLLVLLYAFMFCSGPVQTDVAFRLAEYGLANLSFLLLTADMLSRHELNDRRLFLVLGCLVLAMGVVSIASHLAATEDTRFGIGPWPNVNTGAAILGLIATGLLGVQLSERSCSLASWLILLLAAALIFLLVATGSRAPLLAALVSLAVLIAFTQPKWVAFSAVAVIATIAVGAISIGVADIHSWISRSDGQRLAVWRYYADLAFAQPIIGYGINNEWLLRPSLAADSPHNMLLSMTFYGGAGAGVAYLALVLASVAASISALVQRRHVTSLALVVYSGVHGVFESVLPFHRASWIWLYFWLPLAFAAAAELLSAVARPATTEGPSSEANG